MEFINGDKKLSIDDITVIQETKGLLLSKNLIELYLRSNGGEPFPYVFQNDDLDTVVSLVLPLKSDEAHTSVEAYSNLVLRKRIIEKNMFPFAVDGGGDYFLVDTKDPNELTYFLNSDSSEGISLIPLNVRLSDFWDTLKPE